MELFDSRQENNVKVICSDMVSAYLKSHGYDGLVSDDHECGCLLDDLMPCAGEFAMNCTAGHRVEGCDPMCGEGCDFHIFPGPRPDNNRKKDAGTDKTEK